MSDIRDLANRARRKARALRAAADDAEHAQALVDASARALGGDRGDDGRAALLTSRTIKLRDAQARLRALLGPDAPAPRVPAGRVLGSLTSVCPTCGVQGPHVCLPRRGRPVGAGTCRRCGLPIVGSVHACPDSPT